MRRISLTFKLKKPIIACGADMKGAFALAKGKDALLFDGFGDLSDPDNLERYEKAVKNAIRELGIKPSIIACDLHPGYFSTQFAENYMLSAKPSGPIGPKGRRPYTLIRLTVLKIRRARALTGNHACPYGVPRRTCFRE